MAVKKIRVIYGFAPFTRPRKYSDTYRSYVYVIGVTGESELLKTFDCDEIDVNDKSWKNGTLTNAREYATKKAKFFGVKPERVESGKVVPRSTNYTDICKQFWSN
jgi:hypothetical protein